MNYRQLFKVKTTMAKEDYYKVLYISIYDKKLYKNLVNERTTQKCVALLTLWYNT